MLSAYYQMLLILNHYQMLSAYYQMLLISELLSNVLRIVLLSSKPIGIKFVVVVILVVKVIGLTVDKWF